MIVHFSAYIPFYTGITGPLVNLLKGNIQWEWTEVHVNALVQGYTKPGSPYRLYLDACDFRLATILQQVQRMQLKDLKEMKAYEHCGKAFEAEQPIPSLVVQITKLDYDVPKIEIGVKPWMRLGYTLRELLPIGLGC